MHLYFSSSRKNIRASLAAVIIFTLVVRGIIPIGYMPDIHRQADQPVSITVCDGMGPMDMGGMQGTADRAPDQNKVGHKFQDRTPCPFSVNALFALGGIKPCRAVPFAVFIIISLLTAFAFANERRFGNSGPRAPPAFA